MENTSNAVLNIEPTDILSQALEIPCPFCGSTDLTKNLWSLDDGEVDAIECNQCCAGAPAESWIKHK